MAGPHGVGSTCSASQRAVFLRSCRHIEFSESLPSSSRQSLSGFPRVSPASFLLVSRSLAPTALSLGLCPGASKYSKSWKLLQGAARRGNLAVNLFVMGSPFDWVYPFCGTWQCWAFPSTSHPQQHTYHIKPGFPSHPGEDGLMSVIPILQGRNLRPRTQGEMVHRNPHPGAQDSSNSAYSPTVSLKSTPRTSRESDVSPLVRPSNLAICRICKSSG